MSLAKSRIVIFSAPCGDKSNGHSVIMKDASKDYAVYEDFYEELGQKYPETFHVHNKREVGSRYWTVISELLPYAKRGLRLIDVGCNDGVYTIPYVLAGGKALGIDVSQSLVNKASKTVHDLGISAKCEFIRANIETSGLIIENAAPTDLVLLSEVLEHLLDVRVALLNIRSMLGKGGKFLLTTPTPTFESLRNYSLRYFFEA